jgi:hypothetical protein
MERVEKDTPTPGASGVGLGWHQRRFGEGHREEQGTLHKSMRGYKSPGGMKNGIVLTQWLYSDEDEHDLTEKMAA